MSGSNSTVGGTHETIEQGFRAYDALPRDIREVIAAAPHRYHCVSTLAAYRKMGLTTSQFRREFIRRICRYMQDQARKTYGPDHPDAQRSRLAGRRA